MGQLSFQRRELCPPPGRRYPAGGASSFNTFHTNPSSGSVPITSAMRERNLSPLPDADNGQLARLRYVCRIRGHSTVATSWGSLTLGIVRLEEQTNTTSVCQRHIRRGDACYPTRSLTSLLICSFLSTRTAGYLATEALDTVERFPLPAKLQIQIS